MAASATNTPSTCSLEESEPCNPVTRDYFQHSSAQRINTDIFIFRSIQERHPSETVTIVFEFNCDLLAFAAAGHAIASPVDDEDPATPTSVKWLQYMPPASRLDGGRGKTGQHILYGEYKYAFSDHDFYVYLVDGRDGQSTILRRNYYIIGPKDASSKLVRTAGQWRNELHEEVWVFNQGVWQKDPVLYKSIQKASWDDVILDKERKSAVITDVDRFFDSRKTYQDLRVPWKRGLIFYGPPGNGKTISIKAMSHSLYQREDPIPTLYVRSLSSYGGPEYSIATIFSKARQTAPCLLVFEDLDSIVTDAVRSFFLNEVDGLTTNDGILMIGSTNHLERLDPGIAKRPSRFDRKYPFPDPNEHERVQYCDYWRGKLKQNKDVEFPRKMSVAIAKITYDFSFAYIQEAFVAALLDIAANKPHTPVVSEVRMPSTSKNDVIKNQRWHILALYAIIPLLVSLLPCMKLSDLCALGLTVFVFLVWSFQGRPGINADFSRHIMIEAPSIYDDDDLDDNILWVAIKKQVKILRQAIGRGANA